MQDIYSLSSRRMLQFKMEKKNKKKNPENIAEELIHLGEFILEKK